MKQTSAKFRFCYGNRSEIWSNNGIVVSHGKIQAVEAGNNAGTENEWCMNAGAGR